MLLTVAVILALYVIALLADWAWFRARLPIEFAAANWSGRWESRQYWGLSGTIRVRLPDPLPTNEDFKAEAVVYYPVYSYFKTGQFVRMDFSARFSPNSPAAAGRTENAIPTGGGFLKFKAIMGNQVVEYSALVDGSQRSIAGGYLSASPNDLGTFHISTR